MLTANNKPKCIGRQSGAVRATGSVWRIPPCAYDVRAAPACNHKFVHPHIIDYSQPRMTSAVSHRRYDHSFCAIVNILLGVLHQQANNPEKLTFPYFVGEGELDGRQEVMNSIIAALS